MVTAWFPSNGYMAIPGLFKASLNESSPLLTWPMEVVIATWCSWCSWSSSGEMMKRGEQDLTVWTNLNNGFRKESSNLHLITFADSPPPPPPPLHLWQRQVKTNPLRTKVAFLQQCPGRVQLCGFLPAFCQEGTSSWPYGASSPAWPLKGGRP